MSRNQLRYREEYEKEEGCSGRDLNPGSATRKAAMLDRIVQPYREKMWLLHHRSIRKPCKNLHIKSFLARFHKVFLLEREMRSLYGQCCSEDRLRNRKVQPAQALFLQNVVRGQANNRSSSGLFKRIFSASQDSPKVC